ncbi:MAG: hypothetical protein KGV46_03200 [Pasteurella sp.]|nr:hypothetical protein [Pasteurella sp.]
MALKKTESYVTVPALKLGIEHLGKYAEQLSGFDKHIREAADRLGDSNKDQNYEKFMDYFDEFWPKIMEFRKDVLEFNEFLNYKKKFIEDSLNINLGKGN